MGATANWYTTTIAQFKEDPGLFVQAGAILGNPQLALWHSFLNHGPDDPASNEGRPGWMYGVRQYGMHTFLMFMTEVMGVNENLVADGFYANTEMLPQEYLFNKVGGQRFREIFADWAAHNTANMDYLTKAQLERALLEVTLAGSWDYFRPYADKTGSQGAETFYLGRVIIMSKSG